ncbi:MAG: class I SAM-dependent methyltransferase [Anaerolineales bacterium]|nr:class I SAM-dependent methyltransferase [Anaerolineales bacterium]
MPVAHITIPIPLPQGVYSFLKKIRGGNRKTSTPPAAPEGAPNLEGDRDIEWTWVGANLPPGRGRAFDFGSGESNLALEAALRGYRVTSVDLTPPVRRYVRHPRVEYLQADLLTMRLPKGGFDLVINCSTVEHVGLAGRYSVAEERPDGDLEAMRILHRAMKSGATMLLTIPVGMDEVFKPLTRVYGKKRLPRLTEGFGILRQDFWWKKGSNLWAPCSRAEALGFQASAGSWNYLENIYALGCLVLKKTGR